MSHEAVEAKLVEQVLEARGKIVKKDQFIEELRLRSYKEISIHQNRAHRLQIEVRKLREELYTIKMSPIRFCWRQIMCRIRRAS